MARSALTGTVALAALALTSLGWAASGPVSSQHPSSLTSSAAGQCSKAEAIAVVKRLGWSDVSTIAPVYKVLCGSFAGPGSRIMVASLYGPDNVGMLYWAVFRWSGSDWDLLLKRRQAAVVTAAGGDIRESVSIYRSGDPRCCPSGGTRSRLWHWNGSRFVAGPWKSAPEPGGPPGSNGKSGYFKTPSANIVCGYTVYSGSRAGESYVGCRIKSGLKPEPPGTPRGCWTNGDVLLRAIGRTKTGGPICPGDDEGDAGVLVYESRARVLTYGSAWSGGGLRCTSAETGLTCRNKSGHGFFLSRESWRRF